MTSREGERFLQIFQEFQQLVIEAASIYDAMTAHQAVALINYLRDNTDGAATGSLLSVLQMVENSRVNRNRSEEV